MRTTSTAFLGGLLLLAIPSLSSGHSNAPTATGETGLFTLTSGETLPRGTWSFSLYANRWDRTVSPFPALLPGETSEWSFDRDRFGASIGYGISDHVELSFLFPYERLRSSSLAGGIGTIRGHSFAERIDASGAGDLRLSLKWSLLGGPGDFSRLALNTFVDFPTGDDDKQVVTGDTGYGATIAWSLFNWVFNVGWRDLGSVSFPGFSVKAPEEILGGVGVASPVSGRVDWLTELVFTRYTRVTPKPDDNLDLTTGPRIYLGNPSNWALNLAVRVDLAQLGDDPSLGGLVGITYAPRWRPERVAVPTPVTPAPPPEPVPEPEPEPEPPPAPEPRPEMRETVHFPEGWTRLDNIAMSILDEVGLRLRDEPAARVHVIGHTDSIGPADVNLRVSRERAEAARDYLVERYGIDAARITVEGRGEAEPAATNETAEGRAQNRRVEIVIRFD